MTRTSTNSAQVADIDNPEARPAAAAELRVERRADGRLWAGCGGELRPVEVVQCFPWSHPGRWVSLRDEQGNEVALVDDPAQLAAAARAAVETAVAEAGFVLRIERVLAVREEIEIRIWRVATAQGTRTFQTARDHWPRRLDGGGGMLVRDVAGDLYVLPEPASLDAASRAALCGIVDD